MASKDQRSWHALIERARTRYHTDRTLRLRIRKGVASLTLVLLLVWFLLPFVWALKTAVQTRAVAQHYPPILWGFDLHWENFTYVLFNSPFLNYLWNGIVTSAVTVVAAMLIGVPHAYALSKYDYKLRNASMYLILAVRVFPLVALGVPFFIMYRDLGLINTKLGVTLVLTMLYEPFIVWILKGFFDDIPDSVREAARLDGCTKFQTFYRVMLPLSKPALASATIFTWLEAFNHFTLVFFLTSSARAQTVPFGILTFIRDNYVPWNIISAASLLGMIPSLLIVIFFQKYLVKGITS